jgi:hypothetical protein
MHGHKWHKLQSHVFGKTALQRRTWQSSILSLIISAGWMVRALQLGDFEYS